MWKLKLSHLFGGYGYYVLIATMMIVPMSALFSIGHESVFDLFFCMILGLILPGGIVYLFQNFMPDVREKVHTAGDPDWRHLEPYEYDELLAQQMKKSPALKYLLIAQIPIILLGFFMMASDSSSGILGLFIMEAIAATVAVSHILIVGLVGAKWENVDGSAEIAEIAIEDTYNVTIHYKHHKETKSYYVFYLPSGRYVVGAEQLYTDSTVKIVRWAGSYLFLRS